MMLNIRTLNYEGINKMEARMNITEQNFLQHLFSALTSQKETILDIVNNESNTFTGEMKPIIKECTHAYS